MRTIGIWRPFHIRRARGLGPRWATSYQPRGYGSELNQGTAGCGPCVHLLGVPFGVPIFDPQPCTILLVCLLGRRRERVTNGWHSAATTQSYRLTHTPAFPCMWARKGHDKNNWRHGAIYFRPTVLIQRQRSGNFTTSRTIEWPCAVFPELMDFDIIPSLREALRELSLLSLVNC